LTEDLDIKMMVVLVDEGKSNVSSSGDESGLCRGEETEVSFKEARDATKETKEKNEPSGLSAL